MTRWLSLAMACLAGCIPMPGSGPSDTASGGGLGGPGQQGAVLSALEWSMVGAWSGSRSGDRIGYWVFTDDRRGCAWIREGDDLANRFEEIHFTDWRLELDLIDSDARIPLTFTVTASAQRFEHDVCDREIDRILPGAQSLLPANWRDIVIDCGDSGTAAIDTDNARLGLLDNGLTSGGGTAGTGSLETGDTGVGSQPALPLTPVGLRRRDRRAVLRVR